MTQLPSPPRPVGGRGTRPIPLPPGAAPRRAAAPRHPFRNSVLLAILAVAVLGLLVGLAFLDSWTNLGVSWGPDLTPVAQADVQPMGINVFLDKEVEPEKIEQTLQMVRRGGYNWVRQAFPWHDIEIAGKGDFTDTRDGRNVSAWAKYDAIVDRATALGLHILARIDAPPGWVHPDGVVSHAPPQNVQDFADFVAAVVGRYKGKIRYFQLWNEPNLIGEWGGPPDAQAYTALLKAAYLAAKQANPDAQILMAPLAPTEERGPDNISDLIYLQQMYDAGAKDYFDIANVMVYGLGYPPGERRTDLKRLNFSRPVLTRRIMERNGDGGKAVWASEYAWISLPPDWTGKPSTWGQSVSAEMQAQYLVEGYERARAEWPWMGVMFVWNFRDPAPLPNEPATYFQIVNDDFTPRPAYTALQDYSRRFPVADTGAHLPNSPALNLRMSWRGNGPSLAASTVITATSPDGQGSITFQGNRLDLLIRAPDHPTPVHLLLDGQPAPGWPTTDTNKGRAVLPAAGAAAPPHIAADADWTARTGSPVWRLTAVDGLDGTAPHQLVFHTEVETDTLTLAGFVVSREPPAAWGVAFAFGYGALTLLLVWLVWRLLTNLAAIPAAVRR